MAAPDMASKRWIWEQYDRHVMGDTVDSSQSMGDAAIVRIHGTNKALAICSDCNPHYVAADPYEGGKAAVAEAYRNLSAVGATPIAITDNLNFGNPEKPATMGYIVKAIEGMAEACRALDFPVVSGNVSLYNETDGVAIPPTPVVGGVGLIEDVSKVATLKGAQDGDLAFLIGDVGSELGASLYARSILSLKGADLGAPPMVDLAATVKTAATVRNLVQSGMVAAVHDVSDGGMACAVTEMALSAGLGAEIYAPSEDATAFLYGENHDRYVLAVSASQEEAFRKAIAEAGLPLTQVGKFGGDAISFKIVGAAEQSLPVATLREAHEGWLPSYMNSVD